MATSGSFSTGSYPFQSGDRYMTFNWGLNSQSIEDNSSDIWWEYVIDGSYQYNAVCSDFYVEIDGEVVFDKPSTYHVQAGPGHVVASGTTTIYHDDSGQKEFRVYAEVGIYDHTANRSGSETFTLPTIARGSGITSAEDVTLGNKCSITWTPESASLSYRVWFWLGEWYYITSAIRPNKTTSYTYTGFTIPYEVAEQITDGTTATMGIALCTYSDRNAEDLVYWADGEITVTVPENSYTQPSVEMTLEPVSDLPAKFSGLYIQGRTKVKATLSGSAKYGATIEGYALVADGSVYYAYDSVITSDYLTNSREVSVYGYAQDSRGIIGYAGEEITVIPYIPPKVVAASGESDVVVARCDANGILSEKGTYLKIKAKRSYSPVNVDGEQKNFCQIRYRYKLESAGSYTEWVTLLDSNSLGTDEVETEALLDGVLDVGNTYLVQVGVIDDVGGSSVTTVPLSTEKVYMHRDKVKRALAFGMYIQDGNCIDIADDIKVRIRGTLEVPVGDTTMTLKEYILAVISEGG